jgi:glycerol-3-phosphate acyltransferase PlsY
MTAGVADVILMALFKAPPTFIGYAAFGGLLVIARHKANIQRLMNGTEPRIGEKSKAAPTDPDLDVIADQVEPDESKTAN